MTVTVTVLHAAEINGLAVRFFRSHREGPDFPFVSLLDLLSAARFPAKSRKLFMENLPREFPDEVTTVAVDVADAVQIVRVCSNGMARGVFEIAQHIGAADIDIPYRLAAVDALNKRTGELGLSEADGFSYSLSAAMR